MATIFRGDNPSTFLSKTMRELVAILNEEAAQMETELVESTPADRGGLRQGWTTKFATERNPVAVIGQSKNYFLSVELGRKPGSGISTEGQQAVALWATRKGVVETTQEAKSLAYRLSEKYKREGRPAQGFAGLANPRSTAPSSPPNNLQPVGGPILAGFQRLRRRLS